MKKKCVLTVLLFVFVSLLALTGCGGHKTLDAPSSIRYENGVVYWNAVEGADGYNVVVNEETKFVSGANYTIDVNEYPINLKIQAVDSTEEHKESDFSEFFIKKLDKVTGFKLVDGILWWDKIDNAEYIVKINNEEIQVKENCYRDLAAGHSVEVEVKAVQTVEGGVCISEFSAAQKINIIETPTSVSFNNPTLTLHWNSVSLASGYTVKVEHDGKEIVRETIAQNVNQFAYDYSLVGKYSVSVKANGVKNEISDTGSKFSEPMEIVRLSSPEKCECHDSTNNTTDIEFESVPGAVGYILKINSMEEYLTKTSYKYAFEKSENEVGRYIELVSKGDGKTVLDSIVPNKFELTQLAIPRNIAMSNGVIKWNSVNHAQGYIVTIDGEEKYVDNTQFNLEAFVISAGRHEFSVRAKGDGRNIISSWNSPNYQFSKLLKPTDLYVNENVLTWQSVTGCSNYIVEMGDVIVQTARNNSYLIKSDEVKTNSNFKIKAKGNGKNVLDSDYSDSYLIYKLDVPENIATDNFNVNWNPVNGAKKYQLKFNNMVRVLDRGTAYSWNEFEEGQYKISVKAIGDGSKYFDSEYSEPFTVKKLGTPQASIGENGFEWTKVIGADRYEVYLNGELFFIEKSQTDYIKRFAEAGKYNFKVRAVGDAMNSVSSNWSNEIVHEAKALDAFQSNGDFKLEHIERGLRVTILRDCANVQYYIASVGGVEYRIDAKIKTKEIPVESAGDYTIKCKAVGDGFYYIDSNFSETKTVTFLSNPTNIDWRDEGDNFFTVTWDIVNHAESYTITIQKYDINGNQVGQTFTRTLNDTEQLLTADGVNRIVVTIVANGNGTTVVSSETVTKTLSK